MNEETLYSFSSKKRSATDMNYSPASTISRPPASLCNNKTDDSLDKTTANQLCLSNTDLNGSLVKSSCTSVLSNENEAAIPKTPAQRAREYRARKKYLKEHPVTDVKIVKTSTERSRDCRLRMRLLDYDQEKMKNISSDISVNSAERSKNDLRGKKKPKTAAERARDYRERQKRLINEFARERTSETLVTPNVITIDSDLNTMPNINMRSTGNSSRQQNVNDTFSAIERSPPKSAAEQYISSLLLIKSENIEHSYDSNSSMNIHLRQVMTDDIEEVYIKEEPSTYEEGKSADNTDDSFDESIANKPCLSNLDSNSSAVISSGVGVLTNENEKAILKTSAQQVREYRASAITVDNDLDAMPHNNIRPAANLIGQQDERFRIDYEAAKSLKNVNIRRGFTLPKANAQLLRESRARKRASRQAKPPPKTGKERVREHRARLRALQNAAAQLEGDHSSQPNSQVQVNPATSSARRRYAARNNGIKKSAAQRSREYRQRKKQAMQNADAIVIERPVEPPVTVAFPRDELNVMQLDTEWTKSSEVTELEADIRGTSIVARPLTSNVPTIDRIDVHHQVPYSAYSEHCRASREFTAKFVKNQFGDRMEHSYNGSNASTNVDLTQVKSENVEEIYIKEEPKTYENLMSDYETTDSFDESIANQPCLNDMDLTSSSVQSSCVLSNETEKTIPKTFAQRVREYRAIDRKQTSETSVNSSAITVDNDLDTMPLTNGVTDKCFQKILLNDLMTTEKELFQNDEAAQLTENMNIKCGDNIEHFYNNSNFPKNIGLIQVKPEIVEEIDIKEEPNTYVERKSHDKTDDSIANQSSLSNIDLNSSLLESPYISVVSSKNEKAIPKSAAQRVREYRARQTRLRNEISRKHTSETPVTLRAIAVDNDLDTMAHINIKSKEHFQNVDEAAQIIQNINIKCEDSTDLSYTDSNADLIQFKFTPEVNDEINIKQESSAYKERKCNDNTDDSFDESIAKQSCLSNTDLISSLVETKSTSINVLSNENEKLNAAKRSEQELPGKIIPKTAAERAREYRERQKRLINEIARKQISEAIAISGAIAVDNDLDTVPHISNVTDKFFLKKLMNKLMTTERVQIENDDETPHPTRNIYMKGGKKNPKTAAERVREYRARRKHLINKFTRKQSSGTSVASNAIAVDKDLSAMPPINIRSTEWLQNDVAAQSMQNKNAKCGTKIAKTAAERVREHRARRKRLLNECARKQTSETSVTSSAITFDNDLETMQHINIRSTEQFQNNNEAIQSMQNMNIKCVNSVKPLKKNVPKKKIPKTDAERAREYRARKKRLRNEIARKQTAETSVTSSAITVDNDLDTLRHINIRSTEQFRNDNAAAQSMQNMNIICEDSIEHSYNDRNADLTQSRIIEEISINGKPSTYMENTNFQLPGCNVRLSARTNDQFDYFAEFLSDSLRQLPEELANQAQLELRHVLMKFQMLATESYETKLAF